VARPGGALFSRGDARRRRATGVAPRDAAGPRGLRPGRTGGGAVGTLLVDRKRVPLAALATVVAVVLGACGGGSSKHATPTTTPRAPSTSTTVLPGVPRCQASQLQPSFTPVSAGAGQRYSQLVFTNTGSACQTSGYPGLQLLGPGNQPIPTTVARSTLSPVVTVTVPNGGRASSQLHWAGIPLADEAQTGPCEPVASQVAVTPPDATQPTVVAWTLDSVCGHGHIDANPIVLGVPAP
jgi:Domain of unknown function (DUF4232)